MLFYEDVVTQMKQVQGQYIWIVGASSGIGAALAIALSQQGANLILSARRPSQLDAVRAQLTGENHQVLAFDISDHTQTSHAFNNIHRLDRVIFMAAVYDPSTKGRSDSAFIQQSLQVNLGGVYNMLDVVMPFFEAQVYGQINLCGSVAGYFGLPNEIVKGITSNAFEIHFPKKFTFLLKLLRSLPYGLAFQLSKKLKR